MKLLNISICVSKEERERIEAFAVAVTKARTAEYTRRLQAGIAKQQLDQVRGKIAEVAAYHLLKQAGKDPEYPDFQVWDGSTRRRKGHAADIETPTANYGVKSVNANHKDPSWVFQKSDKLGDDAYLLFLVDEDHRHGKATLKWVLSGSEILEFAAPLRMNAPSKHAVYDKHLSAAFVMHG